jgi:pimeloyl-ACP methyl ester carboxylesterase
VSRHRERIRSYERAGLAFDVTDSGPLDGPRVVLLHGFPQRATCWAPVSRLLVKSGLRTLAPDQRGYSPGARPHSRAAYRREHLVDDVLALVDAVGGPVHLVGHDWGAVVAWHLAAERPDLVQSLVTVSVPHPRAFARSLLSSSQALRSWYAVAVQLPFLPEATARLAPRVVESLLRESGMSEEEVGRFRREIVEDGALSSALGWYRGAALSRGMSQPVRVPTTHVWSDGEHALSRRGAELTGEYVDAPYRLEVLAGVTHWIPTQAPERLAEIVLGRVEQRAA